MYKIILFFHVFAAICIVGLVLLQQGKGAALGAAFGSGASQTVFGSRGSGSFLFRLTIGFAIGFFVTSIILNYIVAEAYKRNKAMTLQTTIPIRSSVVPVNNAAGSPPVGSLPVGSSPAVDVEKKLPSLPNEIPERK